MSHYQDRVKRTCVICATDIAEFDLMLDLFRVGDGSRMVEWVHESCAKKAIEIFLDKKRKREAT